MFQNETVENLLNTCSQHLVHQIISSINNNFHFSTSGKPKILITGGGAKNIFLMELLDKQAINKYDIILSGNEIIDYKEAIIFAFLGLLRNLGYINTFRSVTGAISDSSGGLIYDNLFSIKETGKV